METNMTTDNKPITLYSMAVMFVGPQAIHVFFLHFFLFVFCFLLFFLLRFWTLCCLVWELVVRNQKVDLTMQEVLTTVYFLIEITNFSSNDNSKI